MLLLQEVNLKDVLYNLNARRVLMCIYYELGEYDALDSLFESFTTYIRRQKDLGYHRDNYLNLIKFVKRMLQTNMKSEAEKSQLRVDIESTTELTEREWLLAQVK